jgi:DNA uptake protein ComE-like DNA-binding protein
MSTPRQNIGSSTPIAWWIVLAFVPFFNWLPFLYIGLRANHSAWKIWAAVYALATVLVIASDFSDFAFYLWAIAYLGGIVHVFLARGEYQRQMAAKRGVIAQPVTVPAFQPAVRSTVQAVDPVDEVLPSQQPSPVDVNNASEDVIAAMPGIGSVLAKKAVSERQRRGGFRSVEDFGQALGLQPHIVERIRQMVVIANQPVQVEPETNQGRVVDV